MADTPAPVPHSPTSGGIAGRLHALPAPASSTPTITISVSGHTREVKLSRQLGTKVTELTDKVKETLGIDLRGAVTVRQNIAEDSVSISLTNRTVTFKSEGSDELKTLTFAQLVKGNSSATNPSETEVIETVNTLGKEIDSVLNDVVKEAKLVTVALGGENARVSGCPGTHGGPRPFKAASSSVSAFAKNYLKDEFKQIDKNQDLTAAEKSEHKETITKRLLFVDRMQKHLEDATNKMVQAKESELEHLVAQEDPDRERIERARADLKELKDTQKYYHNFNALALCIAAVKLPANVDGTRTENQMLKAGEDLEKATLAHPALKGKKIKDKDRELFAKQMRLLALPRMQNQATSTVDAERVMSEAKLSQLPRIDLSTQMAPLMLMMGGLDRAHMGNFVADAGGMVNPLSGHEAFFAITPKLKIGDIEYSAGDYLKAAAINAVADVHASIAELDGTIDAGSVRRLLDQTPQLGEHTFASPTARADIAVGATPPSTGPALGPERHEALTQRLHIDAVRGHAPTPPPTITPPASSSSSSSEDTDSDGGVPAPRRSPVASPAPAPVASPASSSTPTPPPPVPSAGARPRVRPERVATSGLDRDAVGLPTSSSGAATPPPASTSTHAAEHRARRRRRAANRTEGTTSATGSARTRRGGGNGALAARRARQAGATLSQEGTVVGSRRPMSSRATYRVTTSDTD